MSANVEAMVREGIAAVKGNKKEEGRILLTKAVELDPYNEEGWLWLSGVVEGQDDQRTCLENVLAINPANEKARKGLDFLSGKPLAPAAPAPKPEPEPIIPANAAATVTSVEWDFGATETSSPSSGRSVDEPSPQDYDDWVSGLGLKTESNDTGDSPVVASPFVDFDDDFFNAGPFDEPQDSALPAAAPEHENLSPAVAPPISQSIPYTPPPSDFGEDIPPFPSSEPEPAAVPAPKGGKRRGGKQTDDGLGAPIAVAAAAAMPMPLETNDNFDDFGIAAEIFPMIPKSIAATRLPGTNERPPILLVLLSLLLIVGNVALAVTVVMKLINPA